MLYKAKLKVYGVFSLILNVLFNNFHLFLILQLPFTRYIFSTGILLIKGTADFKEYIIIHNSTEIIILVYNLINNKRKETGKKKLQFEQVMYFHECIGDAVIVFIVVSLIGVVFSWVNSVNMQAL